MNSRRVTPLGLIVILSERSESKDLHSVIVSERGE
jgi:hypothetical protein